VGLLEDFLDTIISIRTHDARASGTGGGRLSR
jgi:hypothetical protein